MTPKGSVHPARAVKGAGGLLFTGVFLGAMLLLYVGERLFGGSDIARPVLGGLGVAGILFAVVGRVLRRRRLPAQARGTEGLLLACYLVAAGALLLYLAQTDLVLEHLRPMLGGDKGQGRLQGALAALWPLVWLCGVLPLVFMEISYAPMDVERTLEPERVRRSARSALVLACSLGIVFLVNFIASEFNKKVDLSYFKTTRPSESSTKMVQNLGKPMRALLFFPGANEVQEQVEAYFTELASASGKLKVERLDHVMEPVLAKEMSVSDNGVVVLVQDKQHEPIHLGTKLEQAKSKLRQLDSEFQGAFLKLTKNRRVAYLTVGHEERGNEDRDELPGTSIRILRDVLQKLNYQVRDLGIAEGLASEVPTDATVVIVAGPRKPFMEAEEKALVKYLKGGGRVLVMLDPDAGLDMAGLLGPMGLRFKPVLLTHDRLHVRATFTPADRHFLQTNRFSSHPSVTTLSRNASRMALVVIGAGALEEVASTDGSKPQVQFTVHAMPETYGDMDQNHQFDPGKDQRQAYELAAAVTLPLAGKPADRNKPMEKDGADDSGKDDSGKDEARMLVLADSDVFTDQVLRQVLGAGALLMDSIRWLGGEEKFSGETQSEEDVRIVHTRKEDQVWFYLTIFGVPALVLGAGLLFTHRRRRRS